MHKNVEILLGRLVTDTDLRRRFTESPEALLRELRGRGLELTEVELGAVAATDPRALATLADALDPRVRRAPLSTDRPFPDGTTPSEATEKETAR